MTHSMRPWLRRLFLHILPPLLLMKSPKLKERQEQDALAGLTNSDDRSIVVENPSYRSRETNANSRKAKDEVRRDNQTI